MEFACFSCFSEKIEFEILCKLPAVHFTEAHGPEVWNAEFPGWSKSNPHAQTHSVWHMQLSVASEKMTVGDFF